MGRIYCTMVSAIRCHLSARGVLKSPGGWTEELSLAERTRERTPDTDRHQSMMDKESASLHGYCGGSAFAVGLVSYGPALYGPRTAADRRLGGPYHEDRRETA